MLSHINVTHPHFRAMMNYQKLHIAGKKPNHAWVMSFCLYERLPHPELKCTLQIVLAERLILFRKDPTCIINYELDRGDMFYRLSHEERKQVMDRYIDNLLRNLCPCFIRIVFFI